MSIVKRFIEKIILFFKGLYKKYINSKVHKFFKKRFKSVKKAYKKFRYLDKTDLKFYAITGFVGVFCTFVATTYSIFTVSKTLDAAVITIAKLNFTMASNDSALSNQVVTVPANQTVIMNIDITSENAEQTKYALNYATNNPNIKVYYSEDYDNNMAGIVGAGSTVTLRVVFVNEGNTDGTTNLNVAGGYVNNELNSNITEGYYESDIVVRINTFDSITNEGGFGNKTQVSTFPAADSGYVYYDTHCNEKATPQWSNSGRTLNLNNITKRISCDTYFKKLENDIEIYYELRDRDGLHSTRATSVPSGQYTFQSAHCSNDDAVPSWDSSTNKLSVSNIKEKTLCVALFNANS